jgi:hypothetical protein
LETELTKEEKRQKFWWEVRDLIIGAALPFMLLIIFSTTIIMFASLDDTAIEALAIVGGEVLVIAAYIIFGRQNGATAYRKYILGSKKRQFGTEDKKAIYKTGEYALWKGALIGFLTTLLFIIFQIINLAAPNNFCQFILLYACGWAYYPLTIFNLPEGLNFIMIIIPVASHMLGYFLGKKKEIKMQERVAEEQAKQKNKKKKK